MKILKPKMLYDKECMFCCYWIERWKKITRHAIVYIPLQDAFQCNAIDQGCLAMVQLHMSDGKIYYGAHAVLKAFSIANRYVWLLWAYEHIPLFGYLSESIYIWISHNRQHLGRFMRRN